MIPEGGGVTEAPLAVLFGQGPRGEIRAVVEFEERNLVADREGRLQGQPPALGVPSFRMTARAP